MSARRKSRITAKRGKLSERDKTFGTLRCGKSVWNRFGYATCVLEERHRGLCSSGFVLDPARLQKGDTVTIGRHTYTYQGGGAFQGGGKHYPTIKTSVPTPENVRMDLSDDVLVQAIQSVIVRRSKLLAEEIAQNALDALRGLDAPILAAVIRGTERVGMRGYASSSRHKRKSR